MYEKDIDVVGLGELLIDFTENGISAQGNPLLEANPGGAPCNLLSMLCRLGKKTAFIGKVGDDGFGRTLVEVAEAQGIDCSGVSMDKEVHTTLAIVHTLPDGDREFSFYRKPGADMMLKPEEINKELIGRAKVFHFGSLSLTNEPVRSATKVAIEAAKEAGCLISFDPNLRPPLWDSLDEAHEQIHYGLTQCQILKISDNEIQWFTGEEDFDKGIEILRNNYPDIKLICLSKGGDGSTAYAGDCKVSVPSFNQLVPIETTGAGDTFGGCMLNYLLENNLEIPGEEGLTEMLRMANAAAKIVTTRKGALKVMPTREEVLTVMAGKTL